MIANPQAITAALRAGRRVRDSEFDLVYPADVRRVSARFWTPVDVAITAARWLKSRGCKSVLDVGSGAGKLSIVANLATGCPITGLEQRAHLLETARAAAAIYGAQVEYLHGTLETTDTRPFDAFYLYNPFGENLYAPDEQFDHEAELSALRWTHDVSIVEHLLDQAPLHTCLVTFHGFGGRIPSNYELAHSRERDSGPLRLWTKTEDGPAATFVLENALPEHPHKLGAAKLTAAKR
jgi:predicted RNA methylase